jgi:hypothetical protein
LRDEINRERLARIAGLLFSDQDGEVVAAARAIRRLFDQAGGSAADWVSFLREGAPVASADPAFELLEMCRLILLNEGMMLPRERQFVKQMRVQLVANRSFEMTERQAAWFAALFTKYGESA